MIKKLQVSSKLGWEIPHSSTYFSQSICRRTRFFFFPPKTRCFGQKLTPPPCGVAPYWSCHIESRLTGLTIHSCDRTGPLEGLKTWRGAVVMSWGYSFPPGWDRVNWSVKTLGAMPAPPGSDSPATKPAVRKWTSDSFPGAKTVNFVLLFHTLVLERVKNNVLRK